MIQKPNICPLGVRSPISVWPLQRSGKANRPASPRSAPNGIAWCFSTAWQRLPANTCKKEARSLLKDLCARANGRGRTARFVTPPKLSPAKCRCSTIVTQLSGPKHNKAGLSPRDPAAECAATANSTTDQ